MDGLSMAMGRVAVVHPDHLLFLFLILLPVGWTRDIDIDIEIEHI